MKPRECIVCGKPATTTALYDPLCAECVDVEMRLRSYQSPVNPALFLTVWVAIIVAMFWLVEA